MSAQFLPVNRQDMAERGWDQVDFAYVSGDAYVDHPSFGAAIIRSESSSMMMTICGILCMGCPFSS